MEKQDLVSVVMCVHNGEPYIAEAIDSLYQQTYPNWELMICDDASTDGTLSVIEPYAVRDPRIRILRNETVMRQAYSRNKCIAAAKGAYIAVLDADDVYDPTKLSKQVRFLEEHPDIVFVGTGAYLFQGGQQWSTMEVPARCTKAEVCRMYGYVCASLMFRRLVFDTVKGYRVSDITRRGEDWDLICNLVYHGFQGANVRENLYGYRVDDEAYKRRTFSIYLDTFKIRRYWFHRFKLPAKEYIFVLQPLLSGIIPKKIMQRYHEIKGGRHEG